nr:probable mitochondrial intermediate peptidase, mitochondrial isoform X1 [Ipomoea batatas]
MLQNYVDIHIQTGNLLRRQARHLPELTTFYMYLNSNHSIYKAVLKAEQEGNSLTEEGKRAARFLRMDLENGGIHLSPGALPIKNWSLFFKCSFFQCPNIPV